MVVALQTLVYILPIICHRHAITHLQVNLLTFIFCREIGENLSPDWYELITLSIFLFNL